MEMIRALIGPDGGGQSPAQLSVRAIVLFVFGIICVRIAGRRTFAQAAPLDIIVYLIVGSNLSRVMTGGAAILPTMAATLTLVVLHRLLAYATLRPSFLATWIKARPLVLVRDGAVDHAAMARSGLSEEDLCELVRLQKVRDPADVALATLERAGKVSVIPRSH